MTRYADTVGPKRPRDSIRGADSFLSKYSDDEARDEKGQWTSGGASNITFKGRFAKVGDALYYGNPEKQIDISGPRQSDGTALYEAHFVLGRSSTPSVTAWAVRYSFVDGEVAGIVREVSQTFTGRTYADAIQSALNFADKAVAK